MKSFLGKVLVLFSILGGIFFFYLGVVYFFAILANFSDFFLKILHFLVGLTSNETWNPEYGALELIVTLFLVMVSFYVSYLTLALGYDVIIKKKTPSEFN